MSESTEIKIETPSSEGAAPTAENSGEFARLLGEQEADQKQDVKAGDKVNGVLVKVGPVDCFVDFGGRSEGRIKATELQNEEGKLIFAIGEPIEAYVVEDQAEILLTRFLHQHDKDSDKLYQAYKSGIPVEGQVKATNKWGLGVEIQGVRAFCPISQIDLRFVEDPQSFRDQVLQFKIIRYSDQGRNIVLSRRALLEKVQEEQAGEVRSRIVEGADRKSTRLNSSHSDRSRMPSSA